jgi:hypothetical protein
METRKMSKLSVKEEYMLFRHACFDIMRNHNEESFYEAELLLDLIGTIQRGNSDNEFKRSLIAKPGKYHHSEKVVNIEAVLNKEADRFESWIRRFSINKEFSVRRLSNASLSVLIKDGGVSEIRTEFFQHLIREMLRLTSDKSNVRFEVSVDDDFYNFTCFGHRTLKYDSVVKMMMIRVGGEYVNIEHEDGSCVQVAKFPKRIYLDLEV